MQFRTLLILLAFLLGSNLFSQTFENADKPGKNHSVLSPDSLNILTIYVIPSKVKYDWSSPAALYRSYVKNYKRNLLARKSYLLGHAFMEFHSPAIPGKIMAGMRSVSKKEKKQYVFKEHYGLSILGTDLQGRLEYGQELEHKKIKYSRKGDLAFIRVLVSDRAADRMLEFFRAYVDRFDTATPGSVPYGGSFYPRYDEEGAGCSAFVISFLDVAGLMREEYDKWKIEVDIPMDLLGGPYNEGNEVKFKDIRDSDSWAQPSASNPEDYEPFMIFDPTLMYDWVTQVHNGEFDLQEVNFVPLEMNKANGIEIDGRNIPVPADESIITERKQPSIFIDHYLQKNHVNGH